MLQPIKKLLEEKLKDKLTKKELSFLPSGYQKIGDILILNLDKTLWKYEKTIGKILLENVPRTKTVCRRTGFIQTMYRKPQVKVIAGEKKTETIHKEHGVIYKLDVKEVMFAKGNLNERRRIIELVKDSEIIVDFFAGIGYFSIGIAKFANPRKIYSIEINPRAYHYLCENIRLNRVQDKIIPILGDCRKIAPKLGKIFDRIIMGLLPSCKDYLPYAMQVIKSNGIIHYHGTAKKEEWKNLLKDVKNAAEKQGMRVKLLRKLIVKSYAPKVYHWVLDCKIIQS